MALNLIRWSMHACLSVLLGKTFLLYCTLIPEQRAIEVEQNSFGHRHCEAVHEIHGSDIQKLQG